jgi:predicted solute-binding protein
MVFAVWAVKNLVADPSLGSVLRASAAYGKEHIEEVIALESKGRDLPEDLVRRYLTKHISYDFGEAEQRSLALFLRSAAELGLVEKMPELAYLEQATLAERD